MTLAELGSKLREAREARGMTVADVADRLKIPGRILQGVEEASEHLPRTVYVHHFIKDYAKLMGFSAAEIAEWAGSLEGFENISRPAIAESQPFTPVKPSMLPVVLGAVFKLVITAALAFAAYSAYVHFFASRDYEEVTPAQEQAAPAAPAEKPAAPAAPVWENSAPAEAPAGAPAAAEVKPEASPAETPAEAPAVTQAHDSAVPAEAPATPAAPVWENAAPASSEELVSQPPLTEEAPAAVPAEAVAPAASEAAPAPAETPSLAVLPEGMHHVEVIADRDECWMGFTPDGRRQQRTLRKGDSFTMTFRDSLTVKLGNAGAVRVIYDGKELDRAADGRVLNLRFPPEQ